MQNLVLLLVLNMGTDIISAFIPLSNSFLLNLFYQKHINFYTLMFNFIIFI